MPDQPMEERIREALGDHYIMYRLSEWLCTGHGCLFASESFNEAINHQAAVMAGIVREAQAKALEDAADHLDPQTHINPDGTKKPTLDTVLLVATHATAPWLRQIARGIRGGS